MQITRDLGSPGMRSEYLIRVIGMWEAGRVQYIPIKATWVMCEYL